MSCSGLWVFPRMEKARNKKDDLNYDLNYWDLPGQKHFKCVVLPGRVICLCGFVFLKERQVKWKRHFLYIVLQIHFIMTVFVSFSRDSNPLWMWLRRYSGRPSIRRLVGWFQARCFTPNCSWWLPQPCMNVTCSVEVLWVVKKTKKSIHQWALNLRIVPTDGTMHTSL